jgi:hypothetical protein
MILTSEKTYKVVQHHGDTFCSLMTHGDALVEYGIGKWSKAPSWLIDEGLGLCCFKELDQARSFALKFAREATVILECSAFSRMDWMSVPCNVVAIGDGIVDKILYGKWEPGTEMFKSLIGKKIIR